MSNFGVKLSEHRTWPQPTRDPANAVTIAPHWRTTPITPKARPSET
jgi:hypothetical protein